MNLRELLIDTSAFLSPVKALEALHHDVAERRLEGVGHSIAEIVAHMIFWQEWFCRRCDGIADPIPATAAGGWPAVRKGEWKSIEDRFVSGLERAAALANRLDQPVAPAIEVPPLAHLTVRDAVVHMAQHNAHHMGQVILLRQMQGAWPPPSGSYTW